MSHYASLLFITGPKETVKRILDEAIPKGIRNNLIRENEGNCTVALYLEEDEWYEMNNSGRSVEDLVRTYGVTVFEDVYDLDCEDDFCSTTIIEPGDGSPKSTHIEPRHSFFDYENDFEKLIEYDPERYRKVKIEALEALTHIIQREIGQERIKVVKEHAAENGDWVFIPKDVTEIETYDFNGFLMESIEVDSDNPVYCSEGNCLLSKDRTVVILGCKNSVIPEGVSEIGCRAFAGCKDLVHIDIPDSVKIMHGAFDGCPCEANFEKRYSTDDLDWIDELMK